MVQHYDSAWRRNLLKLFENVQEFLKITNVAKLSCRLETFKVLIFFYIWFVLASLNKGGRETRLQHEIGLSPKMFRKEQLLENKYINL